jgi:hypothetical protein
MTVAFTSAYRSLSQAQKAFVDGYVSTVENEANRRGERISLALNRAIPDDVVQASRGHLDSVLVRAAISERITSIAAERELAPQRVLKELMALAFSNMGDYGEAGQDGGFWLDLSRCTPEQLSAIQSIEIEEGVRGGRKTKIKLYSKMEGLDKLMRFMGMYQEDNPIWRNDMPVPDRLALPAADATVDAMQNDYAKMING